MEALGLPLNLPVFLSWLLVLQFYCLLSPSGDLFPFAPDFLDPERKSISWQKLRILHYVSYDQNSYQIFRAFEVLGRKMLTRFGSYSIFANIPTESTFSCNFWCNLGQRGIFLSTIVSGYFFCMLCASCYYAADITSWEYFNPFAFSYKNYVIF